MNSMKIWKIGILTTLAIIGVALITVSAFALNRFGTATYYGYPASGTYPTTTTPTQPNTQIPTPTYPNTYGGWGWGCRGRWGWGYAAPAYPNSGTTATQLTIDQAVQTATNFLTSLNNPDLKVAEVEEYTQNFYVQFSERNTGIGAFEMLVDKYTGAISPEMGPNMIWNTKYGMMSGGMMGWLRGTPTAAITVTVDQAKANAQQFLNANYPGTAVGDVKAFYGYYHVMVLLSGNGYGMFSVNGYTGQVWYHTWHGTFIQELELS